MALTRSRLPLTAVLLLLSLYLSATASAAQGTTEIASVCQSEWLPLHTGNYWVYRIDSRFGSGIHRTHRVLGPYELDGKVWCQIEAAPANYLLRADAEGRILQRSFSSPDEQVQLDPRGLTPHTISSPLGFGAPAIDYSALFPLNSVNSTYVQGIGRISMVDTSRGGSSGGFSSSETLIEAWVDGKLYRSADAAQPVVQLDLFGKFRNCAVPCYYVACGLGTPVDPPNANKPCLEARVAASSLEPNSNLVLSIAAADGQLRYERSVPISSAQPVYYQSLPFYDQRAVGTPITLFPAGDYFITLTALDPSGKPLASTTRAITLK